MLNKTDLPKQQSVSIREGIRQKKEIAQLIIARLDGNDINKKFKYYQSLVKKGIGGFVVFGGRLKDVSNAIRKLQHIAEIPLFIASDLERGVGQQIEGGTLFPPQMAIAQAINRRDKNDIRLLRRAIDIIAKEAKATGINVIFCPVLDVNTNPNNPIISTRAFSDNPKEVAWFGKEFIKGLQKQGLIACAKHFPGHGDTDVDSHVKLPVVKADMKRLKDIELYPFRETIKAGVKSIMVGHLKVPAIDHMLPTSISEKTIKGLLKDKMGFQGLVITDAMNMGAIKYKEEKACLMALKAGADVILHPSKPERVMDYLASRWEEIADRVKVSFKRVIKAKEEISKGQGVRNRRQGIGAKASWQLAYELTKKSIKIRGDLNKIIKTYKDIRGDSLFTHSRPEVSGLRGFRPDFFRTKKSIQRLSPLIFRVVPLILIIDDDNNKSGKPFVDALKRRYKKIKSFYVDNNSQLKNFSLVTSHSSLIIAVFSRISAWKGRSGLSVKLKGILKNALSNSRYSIIVGFCSPYLIREFSSHPIPLPLGERGRVRGDLSVDMLIESYSGSMMAQEAVAEILSGYFTPSSPSQVA